ncbi:MAG: hypothetical protein SO361_10205 [Lachnospira sp.]|nr:hypothetical protein [Lachnospira sp.]
MKITDERNQLEHSRETVEPEMMGVIEGLMGKIFPNYIKQTNTFDIFDDK